VGEVEEALAEWWQDFQAADDERREDLMDQAKEEQRARQKAQQPVVKRVPRSNPAPRPVSVTPTGATVDAAPADGEDMELPPDGSAPKKRRRRRRKAGGGTGGSGGEGSGAPGRAADA
jgi:poly(A) polymerase